MANGKYLRQKAKQGNPLVVYLRNAFLGQKLNNWMGFLVVAAIAVGFAYITTQGVFFGIGLIGVIAGLAIIITCLVNPELGLYINLVYAFFAYFFSRWIFQDEFPVGVAWDIIILATFLGLFVNVPDLKKNTGKFFGSRPILFFFIIFLYLVLQIANPEGTSVEGWFQIIRKILAAFLMLFIAFNVLDTLPKIWRFLKILFVCATIAALYGCFQQFHGLLEFEEWWVRSHEIRFRLTYVHGYFRKFSIMSDPTGFGIVIAGCGLFFLILGLGARKTLHKIIYLSSSVLMILGMSFSGTRTAYLMLVGGMGLFVLLTINKRSTKFFAFCAVMTFLFLMYVPIYDNPTLIRFRTSFSGTKDESYKVREVNRAAIRPYLLSHPIGGGLSTTGSLGEKYNPGHRLAGFPPDSGYLNKALETGWIGLALTCILYFLTLQYSIRGYFRARSKQVKTLFAAISAFFFSFIIGEIAQEAVGQFTNMAIFYPLTAIMVRLRELSEKRHRVTIDEHRSHKEMAPAL